MSEGIGTSGEGGADNESKKLEDKVLQLMLENKLQDRIGKLEQSVSHIKWGIGIVVLAVGLGFGVSHWSLITKVQSLMKASTITHMEKLARESSGRTIETEMRASASLGNTLNHESEVRKLRENLEAGNNVVINGDLMVHGTLRVDGPRLHGDRIDPAIENTPKGQTIITGFQVAVIGEKTEKSDGSAGTSRALLTAQEGTAGMSVMSFPTDGNPIEVKLKTNLDGVESTLPKK